MKLIIYLLPLSNDKYPNLINYSAKSSNLMVIVVIAEMTMKVRNNLTLQSLLIAVINQVNTQNFQLKKMRHVTSEILPVQQKLKI